MPANTGELATELRGKLTGCRLVDIQAQAGQMPGFVLIFENEKEQRINLGIAAGLNVSAQSNGAQIQALINVNLTDPTN